MVRAIAYIRVSTDRQVKDGTSLVTQRRRVGEYAALKRYSLVKQFVEEGESAKTDKRPVLQEMLKFCKEQRGKIDVLIFPKIDRFARYSADYHYLKGYLREQGIRVESTDERFDDSPSGRFLESLLAATAQFDNDVRSERAYNGMREAVVEGRWVWGAPRGYRNVQIGNKATIEPDSVVGPIIIEAFEQAATMTPVKEVLEWLKSHDVSMSRSSFHRMLHNKAYIGVIEAFGTTQHAAPPFFPLVSERLFRRAQDAIVRRKASPVYERENAAFPLRGTVRCPCGRFLTASWARGRTARYPYYRCRSCARVNLRGEFIEGEFLKSLETLRNTFTFDDRMVRNLKKQWADDTEGEANRQENMEREVAKLEALQQRLTLKVAEGVVPDDLARQQFEEIDSKLTSLKGDLLLLADGSVPFEQLIGHARSFFRQVDQLWLYSELSVRKRIQRILFPQGATLDFEHQCRTANEPPLTDSQTQPDAQLSRVAVPAGKSANPTSTSQPPTLKGFNLSSSLEILALLPLLFVEFADVETPGEPGSDGAVSLNDIAA